MIEVKCAYDEMVDITEVIPNPQNPNTHSDKQIDMLVKIIRYQGWRSPITVSTRSGFVVKGHGRLIAAIKMGCEQVPVDYQDYNSEADEWADMIADNRIAELSEINTVQLNSLLYELSDVDFDLELTGFEELQLEEYEEPKIDSGASAMEDDDYMAAVCCINQYVELIDEAAESSSAVDTDVLCQGCDYLDNCPYEDYTPEARFLHIGEVLAKEFLKGKKKKK